MPSVTGEGVRRVMYSCTLSCLHNVEFSVKPAVDDYITCVRCCNGAFILTITRITPTGEQLDDADDDN